MVELAEELQQLFTQEEIMERLQVSRVTLYRLRKTGLPEVRVGRAVRFNLAAVKAWLDSRGEGVEPSSTQEREGQTMKPGDRVPLCDGYELEYQKDEFGGDEWKLLTKQPDGSLQGQEVSLETDHYKTSEEKRVAATGAGQEWLCKHVGGIKSVAGVPADAENAKARREHAMRSLKTVRLFLEAAEAAGHGATVTEMFAPSIQYWERRLEYLDRWLSKRQ